MASIPFHWRLLVLAVVVGLFLLLDLRRPRGERTRLGEYAFLGAAGLIGAAFGASVDLLTSSISEDYFVFGKELSSSPSLRANAVSLGAQAGASAAVLGAGILLLVRSPARRLSSLVRHLPVPFAVAFAGACLGGAAEHFFALLPPGDLAAELGLERAARFLLTWAIHIGLYAGGVVGLVGVGYRVRLSK